MPHDLCNNLPQGHVFHRVCSVVTHYIQHVSAIFFDKPVFIIDCTRRQIVNMTKQVSGVYKMIFVRISYNSCASMVLFRQWLPRWISIKLLSAISPSI